MSVLSRFSAPALQLATFRHAMVRTRQPVRHNLHVRYDHEMNIRNTDWHWKETLNWLLFYTVVIGGPLALASAYTSLFIGDAKLVPIPEVYEPKEEEYEKKPITRFMTRNGFWMPEQMKYECAMHDQWAVWNNSQRRALIQEVKRVMANEEDYAAWFYNPYSAARTRVIGQIREDYHTGKGSS